MKKNIFLLFVLIPFTIYSQTIEQKLSDLVNTQALFKLKRELQKTDSTKTDKFVWNMANAFVNTYFYKPYSAIQNLKILLDNYQTEMGWECTKTMISMMIENYVVINEFDSAKAVCKRFMDRLKGTEVKEDLDYLRYLENEYEKYSIFSTIPECTIYIPGQPFDIERDKISKMYQISVSRNQTTHNLVFDTGAGITTISEKIADDFDVKILSISMSCIGGGGVAAMGKIGVIDSIRIGNIVVNNMKVLVLPDSSLLQPLGLAGTIGCDFMRELKTFEIKDNKFYPNIKNDINLGNMMYMNMGLLSVECFSDSDTLLCEIDTGATLSRLFYYYYKSHNEKIKPYSFYDQDTTVYKSKKIITKNILGVGGYVKYDAVVSKNFPITIGDGCIVPTINVEASPSKRPQIDKYAGTLGQDVMLLYKRLIVDFETMSIVLKHD